MAGSHRDPDRAPLSPVLRLGGEGDWQLDRSRGELRHRGSPVEIRQTPFRVFAYLIAHRDRFVSTAELLDQVWEESVVGAAAVASAVKQVRRALNDDVSEPVWIESRRGRGYRFIAPVESDLGPPNRGDDHPPPSLYVGRSDLMSRLDARVGAAAGGRGGAVLLSADPGMGKTATAARLAERAHGLGMRVVTASGRMSRGAPAPWIWRQVARRLVEDASTHSDPARVPDSLTSLATRSGPDDGSTDAPTDGAEDRFRLHDSIGEALRAVALARPMLLVLEDLEQADEPSLHLLDHLLPRLNTMPILILGTLREGGVDSRHPVARTLSRLSREADGELVQLRPLSPNEAEELVAALTGKQPDAPKLRGWFELTGGNPFFLRELALAEAAARQTGAPMDGLPHSIRNEIRGRLADLGSGEVEILRVASVFGDRFDRDVLASASKRSPEAVDEALSAAGRLALLRWDDPGSVGFTCPIIREAIYADLAPVARGEIHRRVSEALEIGAEDAGDPWWMRIGDGQSGGAHRESLRQLERGFEALGDVAAGQSRDELELELQSSLARALSRVHGWAGESIAAWERAAEHCDRVRDPRRAGIVRFGLAAGLLTLGRIDDALQRYDEILLLGDQTDDRMLKVAGCIRGVPLLYRARLEESAASLQTGCALVRADDQFVASGFSEDFAVTLPLWYAWVLWLRGDVDRAWDCTSRALALARTRGLFVEVSALLWTAVSALLRRDLGVSESLASEALEIARREGYRLIESVSGMTQAVTRGLTGDRATAREATTELIGWLQRSNDSGNRSGSGLIVSELATLQLHADLPTDAEGTIAVGLALSQETGAFFNAELLRLRGEAALRQGDRTRALGDFDAALELARSQQAAALVLRAATSKARVLRDEGRGDEALAVLRPALAGVNGGAGLPDRHDAEELIASLSG